MCVVVEYGYYYFVMALLVVSTIVTYRYLCRAFHQLAHTLHHTQQEKRSILHELEDRREIAKRDRHEADRNIKVLEHEILDLKSTINKITEERDTFAKALDESSASSNLNSAGLKGVLVSEFAKDESVPPPPLAPAPPVPPIAPAPVDNHQRDSKKTLAPRDSGKKRMKRLHWDVAALKVSEDDRQRYA
jgi:hypothetical protein